MSQNGEFFKFIAEFGSSKGQDDENTNDASAQVDVDEELKKMEKMEKMKRQVAGYALMQIEERNMGAIPWKVYMGYMKAGKGQIILPILLLSLVLLQGATVMSSYWFVDCSIIVTTFVL